jgi:hypothetical protein
LIKLHDRYLLPGQRKLSGLSLTFNPNKNARANQKTDRANWHHRFDAVFVGSLLRTICSSNQMDISRQLRQPAITYKLREQSGKVIADAHWQGKPMHVHIEIPEQPVLDQTLFSAEVLAEAKQMYEQIRARPE